MKLSCELCSFSHKLFNNEPSAEKPHSTYDCKNLNARMVMVALESGNSSPLFKLLVEILGLPCKFNKSTWGKHVKKFKTAYESAAYEVLLKSREKACDSIAEKCFDIWGILKMASVKSVVSGNNCFSVNHIIRCRSKFLLLGFSNIVLVLILR